MPKKSVHHLFGALALLALPLAAAQLANAAPATAMAAEAADIDKQAWTETEHSNTVQAYQAYLDAFPSGAYVGLAKVRMAAMRPTTDSDGAPVKTVKIGHVAPLSGKFDMLGKDNENGARLAVEELNNGKVVIGGARIHFQLVGKDDAADPSTGVRVAHELVAEGVVGVVGHMNSGTTIPASKIYFEAGIPQITPSSIDPRYTQQGFNTAFSLATNTDALPSVVVRYVADAYRPAKIVVVTDGTNYGNSVAKVFANLAATANQNVADRIVADSKASDFTEQAQKIVAAQPDLVYFGGSDTTAAPLLKAIHAMGFDPYFVGTEGVCTETMGRMVDNADKIVCGIAEGKLMTRTINLGKFKEKYRDRFGSDKAVTFSPFTYDAVNILVEAMRKADSTDPARYLSALKQTAYSGVMNEYQFGPNGDNLYRTVTIYSYKNKVRVGRNTLEIR